MIPNLPRGHAAILTATLVALGGCPTPSTCEPGGDPSLTIGTGEYEFQEFDPDDPVLEIVHGPQGGYHSVIGLEATNLDASDLMIGEYRGYLGGEELASSSPWLQMRCNPNTETLQAWGTFLIWAAFPDELHDQTARITVDVEDASGTTLSEEIEVTLWDPSLAESR